MISWGGVFAQRTGVFEVFSPATSGPVSCANSLGGGLPGRPLQTVRRCTKFPPRGHWLLARCAGRGPVEGRARKRASAASPPPEVRSARNGEPPKPVSLGLCDNDLQGSVVVAVPAVRMVQVAVHQVVHMVAVRHRRMAAARPVYVGRIVPRAVARGRAPIRIRIRYLHAVFVDVVAVWMVHVDVVQVVNVITMADGDVAALGAVNMIVVVVVRLGAVHRRVFFFFVAGIGRARGTGALSSPACSIALSTKSSTC